MGVTGLLELVAPMASEVAPRHHRGVKPLTVPVPRAWPELTAAAVLQAVALAHWIMVWSRSWCVNSRVERVRLRAEVERLQAEVALLQEELRIKDGRLARLPPRNRPHYPPPERLAILALKSARGCSAAQTARRLLLTPPTVAEWLRRVLRDGEQSLVRVPVPLNRFPDLVSDLVRRLRTLVPTLGYRRIANLLATAGLHLSATTVKRFIAHEPPPPADGPRPEADATIVPVPVPAPGTTPGADPLKKVAPKRTVVARYPNHVWGCDLTMVPLFGGFWVPWAPRALQPIWPFCWWVAAVVDHSSRCVLASRVYFQQPTAEQVVALFEAACAVAGRAPKYIVTDQGVQFREEYRAWCKRRGIKPRYGAVGRYGSIALIERFWSTLKSEGLRRVVLPLSHAAMQTEVEVFVAWYNAQRPHSSLHGATPDEVLRGTAIARDGPRFEPRGGWPLAEAVKLRAPQGAAITLVVSSFEGRRYLPVVALKVAA